MLIYEDHTFDEDFIDDDSQITTCRMCNEDCPLSLITSGCCPDCASLCASAPVSEDAKMRRARLVSLTRKAFLAWSAACDLCVERETALRPSRECIEESHLLCQHRLRRLMILESRLADESGLAKFSIFNQISEFWPAVPALLGNL